MNTTCCALSLCPQFCWNVDRVSDAQLCSFPCLEPDVIETLCVPRPEETVDCRQVLAWRSCSVETRASHRAR